MSLEQSDIVPFDEETKQKCEIFCDPSYQTRLIKEQVNHLLTPSLARYILSFRTTFGSGDVFPIFLFPFNSELPRIHPLWSLCHHRWHGESAISEVFSLNHCSSNFDLLCNWYHLQLQGLSSQFCILCNMERAGNMNIHFRTHSTYIDSASNLGKAWHTLTSDYTKTTPGWLNEAIHCDDVISHRYEHLPTHLLRWQRKLCVTSSWQLLCCCSLFFILGNEYIVKTYYFYNANGFLQSLARLMTPSVCPLRTFSSHERDTSNDGRLVPLPKITSLIPPHLLSAPSITSLPSIKLLDSEENEAHSVPSLSTSSPLTLPPIHHLHPEISSSNISLD